MKKYSTVYYTWPYRSYLSDALWVPCEYLILHLIDIAIDGCQQLFPANAQGLHCVLCVPT